MDPTVIFGIITMFGWGIADFFVVKAVRKTSSFKTLIWSQTIGLLIFFIIFGFFFEAPALTLGWLIVSFIVGLLCVISFLTFYESLRIGVVSVVAPVVGLWSIIVVVLSVLFLGDKPSPLAWLGIVVAIIGGLLASFKLKDLLHLKWKNAVPGLGYALFTVLFAGIYLFLIVVQEEAWGWFFPVFMLKLFTVLILYGYVGIKRKPIRMNQKVWHYIIIIAVLEVIAFLSFGFGTHSGLATIAAPISAAFPAVTVVMVRIFFKEKLETNQKVGVVMVLCALVLLSL